MSRHKRQSYKPRGKLGVCFYCEAERALTIDHYIPTGRGGTSDPRNLVPACEECNSMKGDLMPEDFFWHCKEILEGLFIEHEKFIPKAKRILASLAPELLSSLNA
jgi:hypothetical protein